MSKKIKGMVFDSTPSYNIVTYEDAKARLKHQTLTQDYEELQKEADAMRSKLEAAKKRKLILTAEVRFLRRRYKYLMKTRNMNLQKQNLVQASHLLKQTKMTKEQVLIRKEISRRRLPLVPEPNSKKKQHIVKQIALRDVFTVADKPCKKISNGGKEDKRQGLSLISPPVSDLNHNEKMHIRKEVLAPSVNPVLDRNQKERVLGANDATLRNSATAFDLNLESTPSVKEASLPSRAPMIDLNEILIGDEDFLGNVEAIKLQKAKKSLIRDINEEQQSDLKLSICRNARESSRPGKRKISWRDPVALRV